MGRFTRRMRGGTLPLPPPMPSMPEPIEAPEEKVSEENDFGLAGDAGAVGISIPKLMSNNANVSKPASMNAEGASRAASIEGLPKAPSRPRLPNGVTGEMAVMKRASGASSLAVNNVNRNEEDEDTFKGRVKRFRNRFKKTDDTGPAPSYDRDILVDQLYSLNHAIQPLRQIVRQADTLMDIIQHGTADFVKKDTEEKKKLKPKNLEDLLKE